MSADDIRCAIEEISELIVYSGGEREACKKMRTKWGWSSYKTRKQIRKIYAIWHREDEQARKFTKNSAIRRIRGHIQRAAARGSWPAVAAFEAQLAKIQGTEEPQLIKVDTSLGQAAVGVLAGMDVPAMAAMVAEYDELLARARAHTEPKRIELVATVIEEPKPSE